MFLRKKSKNKNSYTRKLYNEGEKKIAQKFGEESTELIIYYLKGSKKFQDEKERILIISSLKIVDKTILSIDKDRTVCKTLEKIHADFGKNYNLCFANGGDQNNDTIPEREICEQLGVQLIDG